MDAQPFVPVDFEVPRELATPLFRLEPLGPEHNERDFAAWSGSLDHIRATPGFDGRWPYEMTPGDNLRDLEGHAQDFADRTGFTYSILDGEDVVGCVYIYPPAKGGDAPRVSSWVRADRADLDVRLWRAVTEWLASDWPFERIDYAAR